MRIVAGRHKGRRLVTGTGSAIRPTSDRVREALFNVLEHAPWAPVLAGSRVLDAFCGSGALALEAVSRGAAQAVLFDRARGSLDTARRNVEALQESARISLMLADATRAPPAPHTVDLAFLDPPYDSELAVPALAALRSQGWLGAHTLCVVEAAASDALAAPNGFSLLDRRRYGGTAVAFMTPAAIGEPPDRASGQASERGTGRR